MISRPFFCTLILALLALSWVGQAVRTDAETTDGTLEAIELSDSRDRSESSSRGRMSSSARRLAKRVRGEAASGLEPASTEMLESISSVNVFVASASTPSIATKDNPGACMTVETLGGASLAATCPAGSNVISGGCYALTGTDAAMQVSTVYDGLPPPRYDIHMNTEAGMSLQNGAAWNPGTMNHKGIVNFVASSNQYVDLGPQDLWTGAWTLAVWARFRALNSWSRLFDCGCGAGCANLLLANAGTSDIMTMHLYQDGRVTDLACPKGCIVLGEWAHWVVTGDTNGAYVLYKNGEVMATRNGGRPLYQYRRNQCWIGRSNWGQDGWFDGQIDSLNMWDRALPSADVRLLYYIGKSNSATPLTQPGYVCAGANQKTCTGYEYLTHDLGFDTPNPTGTPFTLVNGAKWTADLDGKKGVVSMNGQNQYIDLGPNDFSGGEMTIAVWVRYKAFRQWSRILDCGNGPDQFNIILANQDTSDRCVWGHAGTYYVSGNGCFVANQWVHYVGTASARVWKLFKNNQLVGSRSDINPLDKRPRTKCWIGRSNWDHDQYFLGDIDSLMLYNAALPENKIPALAVPATFNCAQLQHHVTMQCCPSLAPFQGCKRQTTELGDWGSSVCPAGSFIAGGGCDNAAPWTGFAMSRPEAENRWSCGGHGPGKTVRATCCAPATAGGNWHKDNECSFHSLAGGDWITLKCPEGKVMLTGGCEANNQPYFAQQMRQIAPGEYSCGGGGGSHTIALMCCKPTANVNGPKVDTAEMDKPPAAVQDSLSLALTSVPPQATVKINSLGSGSADNSATTAGNEGAGFSVPADGEFEGFVDINFNLLYTGSREMHDVAILLSNQGGAQMYDLTLQYSNKAAPSTFYYLARAAQIDSKASRGKYTQIVFSGFQGVTDVSTLRIVAWTHIELKHAPVKISLIDVNLRPPSGCDALTGQPPGGTLGTCASKIPHTGVCTITCSNGYKLSGDPRTCFDGVLSGQQTCLANPCPALPTPPANGGLGTCSVPTGSGATCTFTCNPGYQLQGPVRPCTAGVMTGQAQTCVATFCNPLATPPANGGLGTCGNPVGHLQSCSFTCDPGFTLVGAPRKCDNAALSGDLQRCVGNPCNPMASPPPNGALGTCGSQTAHGSSCSVTCGPGFKLVGAPRTCVAGQLTGPGQTCEGNTCDALTRPPSNGAVGSCGTTINHGLQCSVTCSPGYSVQGDPYKCLAGKLNGDQTCVGNPCAALTAMPENGALATCGAQIAHGEKCTITCNPGYSVQGEGRVCFAGTLSGSEQMCVGKPCPALAAPPGNGAMGTCEREVPHGQSCTISCNAGYALSGDARRCMAGTLLGAEQTCLGNPCAALVSPPLYGSLGSCGSTVQHGTTCTFTCDDGYSVKGDPRMCAAGTLQGKEQSCIGNPCKPLSTLPENSEIGSCGDSILHGAQCAVACKSGFTLKGDNYQCRAGILIGHQECIGDPCSALTIPPLHGTLGNCGEEVGHSTSCNFSCNDGYSLIGENRKCYAGTLSGSDQQCYANPCKAPGAAPQHGTLGSCDITIQPGNTCSFECDHGYTLVGEARKCEGGYLQGSLQVCEPSSCEPMQTVPEHGSIGTCGEKIQHGGLCSINCDKGYSISGAALSCSFGAWVGDAQSCAGEDCPAVITPPDNGRLASCGITIPHGKSCVIECEDGYKLQGPLERKCIGGVLLGNDQTCVRVGDTINKRIDDLNHRLDWIEDTEQPTPKIVASTTEEPTLPAKRDAPTWLSKGQFSRPELRSHKRR